MKKEFIVNRQGRDFVLYAGLLDQAHREGLKRISTTLLQAPSDANGQLAICYAEVETEKGIFGGIGDASPQNVGRMIAMHTVRMSETRAKARALRRFTARIIAHRARFRLQRARRLCLLAIAIQIWRRHGRDLARRA
ncbi:MAG TPA: hypothetical protein VHB98_05105 [Chloroflexota bacterium]|nr:hypothetical protein [Chloroflexota bacterium]